MEDFRLRRGERRREEGVREIAREYGFRYCQLRSNVGVLRKGWGLRRVAFCDIRRDYCLVELFDKRYGEEIERFKKGLENILEMRVVVV